MLNISANLTKININEKARERRIDEAVREIIRIAAKEYVRAALKKIPVYYGTAQGSFTSLARIFDISPFPTKRIQSRKFRTIRIDSPQPPRAGPRQLADTPKGPRDIRGPKTGQAFSTFFRDLRQVITFDRSTSTYIFNINFVLPYFVHLDPVWGASEAGKRAFQASLNKSRREKKISFSKEDLVFTRITVK